MSVQKIKMILMASLMISPSLLCMNKTTNIIDIVETNDCNSKKEQFKHYQNFLEFEKQQKIKQNVVGGKKSTGSLLGDLGVDYFIKKEKSSENYKNELLKMKKELEKKEDDIKKNFLKMPRIFDFKRWVITLGLALPTILLSWFNGVVTENKYYTLKPMSNTLAYGSLYFSVPVILFTWFGSGPTQQAVNYFSNKYNMCENSLFLKMHAFVQQGIVLDKKVAKELSKKKKSLVRTILQEQCIIL